MENKQSQPNTGANNSSSANKSSNSSGAGRSTSASARTENNTTSDASESSQQPTASQQSGDQNENQGGASNSSTQQDSNSGSQRKSWLNQDELLKNVNLNQLPQSLKDFGSKAAEQVNKLSSTQKIVGGALLVSGLSWLALRSKNQKSSTYTGSSAGSRYTPKGESKWRSSSDSVYRGTTSSLQDDANDTGF